MVEFSDSSATGKFILKTANFSAKSLQPLFEAHQKKGRLEPTKLELGHEFRLLLRGYEITKSFERLTESALYIRQFPNCYKRRGARPIQYFLYHLETYFSEVYVLKERIARFLKTVKKHSAADALDESKVEKLHDAVKEALKPMTEHRRIHVHIERLDFSEFNIASSLEIIANHSEPDTALVGQIHLDREYRRLRNDWVGRIADWNEQILELLDYVFEMIDGLVFDERGDCILTRLKKASG